MKAFTYDNNSYRPVQDVNGGTQWRCDYPDGEWAAAMVYEKKPTRFDVIEAIERVNESQTGEQQ